MVERSGDVQYTPPDPTIPYPVTPVHIPRQDGTHENERVELQVHDGLCEVFMECERAQAVRDDDDPYVVVPVPLSSKPVTHTHQVRSDLAEYELPGFCVPDDQGVLLVVGAIENTQAWQALLACVTQTLKSGIVGV